VSTIQFANLTPIADRPVYVAQLKVGWADDWVTIPALHPARWYEALMPTMPTAHLTYDVGTILRQVAAGRLSGFQHFDTLPDATDAAHAFLLNQLEDRYLRICAVIPGGLKQVWIGVVVGTSGNRFAYETPTGGGAPLAAGLQTLTAFGLEHLLNRNPIDKGYAIHARSTKTVTRSCRWAAATTT
jgi:hypothetical protein